MTHIIKVALISWFYAGIAFYVVEEMFVQDLFPEFTLIGTILLWPFTHAPHYFWLFWRFLKRKGQP